MSIVNISSKKQLSFPLMCLMLYLCIAPIYWMPGISYTLIKYAKIGLAVFTLFLFFFNHTYIQKKQVTFPVALSVPLILIILLAIPYFLISVSNGKDFFQVFFYYVNFPFGFLTAILAYNSYDEIAKHYTFFKVPYIFILLLCTLPILNFFTGFPDWISPFTLESGHIMDVFWSTGFNASRTGWSGSLVAFIPFSFLFFKNKQQGKYPSSYIIYLLLLIASIFGAQVVSLGRGGMLASLITIFILSYVYFGLKSLGYYFLGITILVLTFLEEIFIALRIFDFNGNVQSLDEVSSVRNQMNREAPDLIAQKPLWGWGYKGSEDALFLKGGIEYDGLEIHNTYLNIAVDNGLLMGLMIVTLALFSIYISVITLRKKNIPRLIHANSCLIISGLIVAMFEPHAIFSSFQQMPLWWIALGINFKYYYSEIRKPVSTTLLNQPIIG